MCWYLKQSPKVDYLLMLSSHLYLQTLNLGIVYFSDPETNLKLDSDLTLSF